MPLTPQEQQELAALEQEEAQFQQSQEQPQAMPLPQPPLQASGLQNLTPEEQEELAQLENEEFLFQREQQKAQNAQSADQRFSELSQRPEAELGFVDRARYAIEPIRSNRMALLQQQLGPENVIESPDGELYVRTPESGEFRPVNEPGFSTADVTEFAGATPEMFGAGAGAVLGLGAGSIPAAGVGGVTGSIARQGVSSLLGTPQVANIEERAAETALSGGLSMLGGAAAKAGGRLLKGVLGKVIPEATERAGKLGKVAAKRKIRLTPGQRLGGVVEEQEKIVRESPVFGRKARRQLGKQIKQVTKELKKEIGDFDNPELSPTQVGVKIKSFANEKVNTLKGTASELFEDVANTTEDIFIPAKDAKKSLLKGVGRLRLFNESGKPLPYKGTAGVSEDAFKQMQRALRPIIGAIDEAINQPQALGKGAIDRSGKISVNELNALRKTLDAQIRGFGRKGKDLGFDDVVLTKIRNRFMDTIEGGLKNASPEDAAKFKAARKLWAEGKKSESLLKELKLGIKDAKEIADEKVLNKIFTDTKALKKFEQLTDKNAVKEAAKSFLQNTFEEKSKDGAVRAGTLLNIVNKRGTGEALEKAFGKNKVNAIRELLEFTKETNIPINPSGTATTQIKQITPSSLTAGLGSRTLLGVLTGAVKLPTGGVKALVQAVGQEPKRDIGFETRKIGVKARTLFGDRPPKRNPSNNKSTLFGD